MNEKVNNVTFEQALEYIRAHAAYLSSIPPRYFEILQAHYDQLKAERDALAEDLKEANIELGCLHMQAYGETREEREARKKEAYERKGE